MGRGGVSSMTMPLSQLGVPTMVCEVGSGVDSSAVKRRGRLVRGASNRDRGRRTPTRHMRCGWLP